MRFSFIGGSYENKPGPGILGNYLRADAQSTINLYKETDKSGAGKSPAQLIGTPGLQSYMTGSFLGQSPVRCLWVGDNRMFAVVGSYLFEVTQGGFLNPPGANLGNVGSDGRPAQIFAMKQGTGLGIVSNGQFYYNFGSGCVAATYQGGGTVAASCGTCMDGYAIIAVPGTNKIQISSPSDFSSWNPLDYAIKEAYPDHIYALANDSINVYVLGNQSMEIWRDTGASDFPFERIPGEVLNIGIAAPSSVDRFGNGIILLASDPRGGPMAITMQGYQWSRVSTPPLETLWQSYANFSDAVGFTYIDGGHTFWVVSFPTNDTTWVYDGAEDSWHQRGYWDGSWVNGNQQTDLPTLHRVRGYLHGYCWRTHYVGDWNGGNIFVMTRDCFTDMLQPIHRIRTAAHIANENKRVRFHQFTLDVQTGQNNPNTYNLQMSNDGGNTYGVKYPISIGSASPNDFAARYNWRRLGYARQRTFRLMSQDPVRHNWIDAYYEATSE